MGTWRVDDGAINRLMEPSGDIGRWHRSVVRRVRAEIVRGSPVRTGRLRAGWQVRHFAPRGAVLRSVVYNDVEYVGYVIRGRGPVVPVRRQFLRFRGRTGEWVFARRVRGVPPNNFVQEGLQRAAGRTHNIKFRVGRG